MVFCVEAGLCGTSGQAQVQVNRTGNAQYEYRVQNVAGQPIVRVKVGIDEASSGNPELLTTPLGWDFDSGSGSLAAPAGWTGGVETLEESAYFNLVWTRSGRAISQGETLGGFVVSLPVADNRYRTAHWTILRADGTITTGTLQPTEPVIAGDVNSDGVVNCADIAIIKAGFGKKAGDAQFDARADVNNDGVIDVRDLSFVSQKLSTGTKCP